MQQRGNSTPTKKEAKLQTRVGGLLDEDIEPKRPGVLEYIGALRGGGALFNRHTTTARFCGA